MVKRRVAVLVVLPLVLLTMLACGETGSPTPLSSGELQVHADLAAARETRVVQSTHDALAVVAHPILGRSGTILVGLAALLATSSAINSTVFGASRMMAEMAGDRAMPATFARRNEA